MVTEALNIPKSKYSISFQSRLGKGWLTPFTDFRLKELPGEGVKKLLIGHFSSKYETLDEFINETSAIFKNAELALEGMCYKI